MNPGYYGKINDDTEEIPPPPDDLDDVPVPPPGSAGSVNTVIPPIVKPRTPDYEGMGLKKYEDLWNGFSIMIPDGWKVLFDKGRIWCSSPPGTSSADAVLIWPVSLESADSLEGWPQQVFDTLKEMSPEIEVWEAEKKQADGIERQMFIYTRRHSNGRQIRGMLRFARDDSNAVAMGYESDGATINSNMGMLETIIRSFTFIPSIKKERYIERSEGAFSFLYPEGWQPFGRVDRTRNPQGNGVTVWSVEDPKTGTRVYNEATSLPMIQPNPLMPPGSSWNVHPFVDAASFANGLLFQLARRQYPDLQILEANNNERLTKIAKENMRVVESRMGVECIVSAGYVITTFTKGGVKFKEWTLVVNNTMPVRSDPMMAMMGMGFPGADVFSQGGGVYWFCSVGPALRAPEKIFEKMFPIMIGIAGSFKEHEAWSSSEVSSAFAKMEQERRHHEAKRAKMMYETQQYINEKNREIWEHRTATNEDINRRMSNAILGKEDVLDEEHRSWKVESGYDTYWKKGDEIIGSNSSDFDSFLRSEGWKKMSKF
ncbi:MAG: hypothetical protein QW728_00325 [Thermoplasmata archaeon]